MWRSSFVATAVALGSPVDDALAAIEADETLSTVARGLKSEDRSVRLATLTQALGGVARALEEVALA
jgi:hypothetical protein